jgi:hypothetical protein
MTSACFLRHGLNPCRRDLWLTKNASHVMIPSVLLPAALELNSILRCFSKSSFHPEHPLNRPTSSDSNKLREKTTNARTKEQHPTNIKFRPIRRSKDASYRPIQPGVSMKNKKEMIDRKKSPVPVVELGSVHIPTPLKQRLLSRGIDITLDQQFGPFAADSIRSIQRNIRYQQQYPQVDTVEEQLRVADYMTAESGSLEELVTSRRILSQQTDTEKEGVDFMENIERLVEKAPQWTLGLHDDSIDSIRAASSSSQRTNFGDDNDDEYDDDDENLDQDPDVRIWWGGAPTFTNCKFVCVF